MVVREKLLLSHRTGKFLRVPGAKGSQLDGRSTPGAGKLSPAPADEPPPPGVVAHRPPERRGRSRKAGESDGRREKSRRRAASTRRSSPHPGEFALNRGM